jgi:signal transduction histidine kinase
MTVSASAEFRGLCRAQLVLLAQGFGSTFGAVYLAEGWTEGRATRWSPLVVYPDLDDRGLALAPSPIEPPQPSNEANADWTTGRDWISQPDAADETSGRRDLRNSRPSSPQFDKPTDSHEIVLPLQQDGQVLGVLISHRDRPWTSLDYAQLDQIAQSLSMGCLLDRRLHWVQDRYQRQELIQEQRQDILDNWIHQLRNPLMALRTFGKLILRRLQPEDPNRSTVESLIREGDRIESLLAQMSQTIDGWMDILPDDLRPEPVVPAMDPPQIPAQIPALEARAPLLLPPASPFGDRLILGPCSVVTLLRPLIESLTIVAEDNNQRLELSVSESIGPALALAEASALQEVFGNLIENALKYSGAGGQVWVHVTLDGDRQLIRVIDNGPGIPASDLGRIFERHYRGIQAQGSKPGSGIGLAIARDFVEQMGGELRVISPVDWPQVNGPSREEPGPGTCFEVRLALA